MPISLPAISRRQWIQNSLAAALAPAWAMGAVKSAEAESWVLFSDTHILADPKAEARGVIMGDNLSRCANQVLKLGSKPYGVLVNGDCAFLKGEAADYSTFVSLISPLREAGIAVHCTLGNHDDRKNFMSAMTSVQDPRPVDGKHVSVFSSATMNWVLLDTLDQVNKTAGPYPDQPTGETDRRHGPSQSAAAHRGRRPEAQWHAGQ
jgi:Icc protein